MDIGKKIDKITTLKELSKYYYLIPKDIKMSEEQFLFLDFNDVLDINNGIINKDMLSNINLVKRGKRKKALTEEMIKEIQESNLSSRKLGDKYGVSHSIILKVKNGEY